MYPNSHVTPSAEGRDQAATEFIIAADWHTRFSMNSAGLSAITNELCAPQDPVRQSELVVMREEALVATLGSGAIALFQRDVLAERADFEAQFAW